MSSDRTHKKHDRRSSPLNPHSPTRLLRTSTPPATTVPRQSLLAYSFQPPSPLEKQEIKDHFRAVTTAPNGYKRNQPNSLPLLPFKSDDAYEIYLLQNRQQKSAAFDEYGYSLKWTDIPRSTNINIPTVNVHNRPVKRKIKQFKDRSHSEGDLSALLKHFSLQRQELLNAKFECDEALKKLLERVNSSIEALLEQKTGDENSWRVYLDSVCELAEICGQIMETDILTLLIDGTCQQIIDRIRKIGLNIGERKLKGFEECEKFSINILIIFSGIARFVEQYGVQVQKTSWKRDDASFILSPLENLSIYDDTDYTNEDEESSGTDMPLYRPKRRTRRLLKREPTRFTSPISSPLQLSIFQDEKVNLKQDKQTESTIILEFTHDLKLAYVSPCVKNLLGFTSTSMIENDSIDFISERCTDHATITFSLKNDPSRYTEDTVPNFDVFSRANQILSDKTVKSVLIFYRACSLSGNTVLMEGQGMILDHTVSQPKQSYVWVTRPLSYPESDGNQSSLSNDFTGMSVSPRKYDYRLPSLENNAKSIDALNDLGLCHICERSIPVTLFGGHSKLCSQVHHADMELSFCNDSLKNYQADIIDKKELLEDEISKEGDEILSAYLAKLDLLLTRTSKLVDELLSIKHHGIWNGDFSISTSLQNVPVELLILSLSKLDEPLEQDYIPFVCEKEISNSVDPSTLGFGLGLYQMSVDIHLLGKNKLSLLTKCRDSSDQYKTAVFLEESVKNQINDTNNSILNSPIMYPARCESDMIYSSLEPLGFNNSNNFPNLYLRRYSEQVQRRQSIVSEFKLNHNNLTVSTSSLRNPRMLLSSDKSFELEPKSPLSGSPLSSRNLLDQETNPVIENSTGSPTAALFTSTNFSNVGVLRTMPSIKDFDILKPISKGAFGSVYLARKKLTSDYFAIKVLRKIDMIAKNQIANIKAERMILTQLDSPFVVKMFFSFQSKNNLYLVMEYLNGGDCAALLKAVGTLDEKWTKQYAAEITLGLEFLHSRGIIHRDLKPDNLLIDSKGHLKVTDFGLSKAGFLGRRLNGSLDSTNSSNTNLSSDSSLFHQTFFKPEFKHVRRDSSASNFSASSADSGAKSVLNTTPLMTNKFVGTPDYLSPESILGIGQDASVDWWAAGVIIYEFLYGIPAFHAETPTLVFENILSRRIDWKTEEFDISPEALDLIDGLLCTNINERLGTTSDRSVKKHHFFAEINWDRVLEEDGEFVPNIKSETDTEYFDDRGAGNQELPKDDCDELVKEPGSQEENADFGEEVYKNLPLLEKANNELLSKLQSEVYDDSNDELEKKLDSRHNRTFDLLSNCQTQKPTSQINSVKESSPLNLQMRFNKSFEMSSVDHSKRNSFSSRIRTSSMTASLFQLPTPAIFMGETEVPGSIASQLGSNVVENTKVESPITWNFDGKQFISSRAMRILIVDDNPLTCKILNMILEKAGSLCDIAYNGAEAFRKCMGNIKYDVIFMDIRMPIMDGEAAARLIKSTENINQSTSIIGMTSYEYTQSNINLFRKMVSKPFNKDKIIKTLIKITA